MMLRSLVFVAAVFVASPALACSFATFFWPTVGQVPVDGWVWVFSFDEDADFELLSEDGTIPLSVRETIPAGDGLMLALSPDESIAPGTYELAAVDDPSESFPSRVTFGAAAPDDAPPAIALSRTGFVLLDVTDSCASGVGDSTLYLCAAAADGALLESRLVDADGTVRLHRVGRSGAYFEALTDDVEGLRLEVRGVGPRGERGPWIVEELAAVEGYAWRGAPPGGLGCGEELTLGSEVLATSGAATPIGAQAGGCSVASSPASMAPLLLLLAALGLRRRR